MQRQIVDKLRVRILEKYPLLQVLLGPRQVGKTTAVQTLYKDFQGSKLFASADSPVPLNADWLETRWLQARALPDPVLLIVDEIQKVLGWSEVVKLLFDQDRGKRDIRVILLGSASLVLQSGLKESLAGRFELLRASHWNLAESREEFGWGLEEYLRYGGYPAAARFISDKSRWQGFIRDSIIEPVLGRDILSSINIGKPALFRQVFEIAMHYPAQELSYQKIVGQLQEKGSTQTVKHYLEILEGAFLLKQLFQYSTRPLSTRQSSPKIIPLAPALIGAFVDPEMVNLDQEWRGRIFESVVGAALLQSQASLYSWRENNQEIDFVLKTEKDLFAVEVKSGRRVKAQGMDGFLRKFPKAKQIVITPSNCLALLSDRDKIEALGDL